MEGEFEIEEILRRRMKFEGRISIISFSISSDGI